MRRLRCCAEGETVPRFGSKTNDTYRPLSLRSDTSWYESELFFSYKMRATLASIRPLHITRGPSPSSSVSSSSGGCGGGGSSSSKRRRLAAAASSGPPTAPHVLHRPPPPRWENCYCSPRLTSRCAARAAAAARCMHVAAKVTAFLMQAPTGMRQSVRVSPIEV